MFDFDADSFNAVTNVVTLIGGALLSGLIIFILINVRRIAERLEQVIAPKTGIEGFLNLCAQVVECDPDGTCIVSDMTDEIVMVNQRFEQMTGYHRSEVVGKPIEIMLPERYRAIHPSHREMYKLNPSNRPMRGLPFRHKIGKEIPVGIWLGHFNDPNDGYTIVKMRAADSDWHETDKLNK